MYRPHAFFKTLPDSPTPFQDTRRNNSATAFWHYDSNPMCNLFDIRVNVHLKSRNDHLVQRFSTFFTRGTLLQFPHRLGPPKVECHPAGKI